MAKDANHFKLYYLNSKLSSNNVEDKFRQLETHEERFALVLKTALQCSSVLFDLNDYETKHSQHSIKLRNSGNKSYVSSQFYNAVKEYTASIVYAPDSSQELALAYANRSAALFNLGKYEDCIKDIDRALNLKYPGTLQIKLHKRKGLCLMWLGKPGANSSFHKAKESLKKMTLSQNEKDEIESELTNLISNPDSAKPQENKIGHPSSEIPVPNPKIPSCSDAVTIEYSEKYGKHMVAARKINPGEILVVEEPFCKRLFPKHVYTNCSYCCVASWSMIPCNYCVHATYCSENCRDKAWDKYHEVECLVEGILLSLQIDDSILLTMRTAIIATKKGTKLDELRQELILVDQTTDPCAKLYSEDGKLHSDQYRSIYYNEELVRDKYSTEQLIVMTAAIAMTVCILARETTIFGRKLTLDIILAANPDVRFFGGLMFKHFHLASQIKSHRIGSRNGPAPVDHGISFLAIGSLFNHSCNENTIRVWSPELTYTYAAYPIEKGDQLFDNYGPEFSSMRRSERREHFKRWKFPCDCLACTENWPMFPDILSYKKQVLLPQRKKKIYNSLQKLKKCKILVPNKSTTNEPSTIDELLRAIKVLSVLAKKPCRELFMLNQLIKVFYAGDDNYLDFEPISRSEGDMQRNMIFSHMKQILLE